MPPWLSSVAGLFPALKYKWKAFKMKRGILISFHGEAASPWRVSGSVLPAARPPPPEAFKADIGKASPTCRSDDVRSGTRATLGRHCHKPFRAERHRERGSSQQLFLARGTWGRRQERLWSLHGRPGLGLGCEGGEAGTLQDGTRLCTHVDFPVYLWRTESQ